MSENLALLPGWSYQKEIMQPLAQALSEHYQAHLYALPTSARAADWLDALDACIPPNTWLIGWSLGGMLATQLAARRGKENCCGLITLCSNPCFYARNDWPYAMPEATFRSFCSEFRQDPASTLKHFDLMVSQGSANKRDRARQLAGHHLPTQHPSLLAGLELLGKLDNRPALRQFSGAQLHLMAENDAFLPAALAQKACFALADLFSANNISVGLYGHQGHALPVTCHERLAGDIISTIKSVAKQRRNPGRTFRA